jgi:cell division protein ZapA
MDDKMASLTININVAGRSYRMKIDEKEEEYVRAAANAINDKVNDFSGNYAFKDKQDLLAMVNITFASELLKLKKSGDNTSIIAIDKLQEIEALLSS